MRMSKPDRCQYPTRRRCGPVVLSYIGKDLCARCWAEIAAMGPERARETLKIKDRSSNPKEGGFPCPPRPGYPGRESFRLRKAARGGPEHGP